MVKEKLTWFIQLIYFRGFFAFISFVSSPKSFSISRSTRERPGGSMALPLLFSLQPWTVRAAACRAVLHESLQTAPVTGSDGPSAPQVCQSCALQQPGCSRQCWEVQAVFLRAVQQSDARTASHREKSRK